MSTFNKIYKKITNNGNDSDYQVVATVGVNGVPLAIMKGADSSNDGEIGLVPKVTKGNQLKYLRGDGTWQTPYAHPSATAYTNGLYKITTNNLGHVIAASAVNKSDITGLGIPSQDTTYGVASSSSNGLMSSSDKSKIDKLAFYEFHSTSDVTAWTSTTANERKNFWPFTSVTSKTSMITTNNGSTFTANVTGMYFIRIRLQLNSSTKRIQVEYDKNDTRVSESSIIINTNNVLQIYNYNIMDKFEKGDKIQFWMCNPDGGSSLQITPIETAIYIIPWF